jgi:hypothetical protein
MAITGLHIEIKKQGWTEKAMFMTVMIILVACFSINVVQHSGYRAPKSLSFTCSSLQKGVLIHEDVFNQRESFHSKLQLEWTYEEFKHNFLPAIRYDAIFAISTQTVFRNLYTCISINAP